MRICFIAAGEIEIPPKGWGALETVVWNQAEALKKSGAETFIINESSPEDALKQIREINPDIVHLHYGKNYEIMPHLKCRKIVTNHDGSFRDSLEFHDHLVRNYFYDCEFFCLTSWENEFLANLGISLKKIKVLPNHIDSTLINFKEKKEHSLICLGKIDPRKRQAFLQSLNLGVHFVGMNADKNFQTTDENYLGPWTQEEVREKLTDYTSLILLSERELQPLVCLEALCAGVGLILSEDSCQNLDTSLPFITVIPNDKKNDRTYISTAATENLIACKKIGAKEIKKYSSQFSTNFLAQNYSSCL